MEQSFLEKYAEGGLSYEEAWKKESRKQIKDIFRRPKKLIIGTLIYASAMGIICFGMNEFSKTEMGKQYNNLVKKVYDLEADIN